MSEESGLRFLDLRRFLPGLAGGGWRGAVRRGLERLLGLPRVWEMMGELDRRAGAGEDPFEAFLALSGMKLDGAGVVEAIPPRGGLIVVCNHPFGGADALAIATLCRRVRKDTRILANAELLGIEPIADALIPLHILGEARAERRNMAALREALAHVRGGGVLVLFPGGAVSHWQWSSRRVEDPPWPIQAARLIRKAGAPVVPVRFFGRNGNSFQLAGLVHPALRTALIPRAFLAMRGKTLRCAAGERLDPGQLPGEVESLTKALREAVEGVAGTGEED